MPSRFSLKSGKSRRKETPLEIGQVSRATGDVDLFEIVIGVFENLYEVVVTLADETVEKEFFELFRAGRMMMR